MSEYKHYFKRQLGINESQFPLSEVDRNSFPGIDPDELERGTEEERDEHGMPIRKAKQTAAQHLREPEQNHYYTGVERAKDQGMLKDGAMLSPTARPTPIIGVAIRGSSSGGLPSGADQQGDISPSKLGGYEKIPIETSNSKLIDKTPKNTTIDSSTPIASSVIDNEIDHPHQIQKTAGEKPQSATGASTDSDDTLTLKSASPKELPLSGMDVDVTDDNPMDTENDEEDELTPSFPFSVNETFEKHKKMTIAKCNENVGAKEPFVPKWKMNKEKAGMVKIEERGNHSSDCKCGYCAPAETDPEKIKWAQQNKYNWDEYEKEHGKTKLIQIKDKVEESKYSKPFERMRGLAGLGKVSLGSNGVWNGLNEVKNDKLTKTCWHCKKSKPCGCDKKDDDDIKLQDKDPESYKKRFGMKIDKVDEGQSNEKNDKNDEVDKKIEKMKKEKKELQATRDHKKNMDRLDRDIRRDDLA